MTVKQEIRALLVADLEALNGAEQRLIIRLEDIAEDVSQEKLKKTLLTQRDIAQKRAQRLERVFKSIDAEPQASDAGVLDAILDAADPDDAAERSRLTTDLTAATTVLKAVQFHMGGYEAAVKLATQLEQSRAESHLEKCSGELEHAGQEMEQMIEEVASAALRRSEARRSEARQSGS
jgi:ferritin-like metal-binding protein YciE